MPPPPRTHSLVDIININERRGKRGGGGGIHVRLYVLNNKNSIKVNLFKMLDNNNKKLKCLLKFSLPCREATLTAIPTLSPRLGQVGVNADGFCTVFNEECGKAYAPGCIIKADVLVYEDRSYEIVEKGLLYPSFLDLIVVENNKILITDLYVILNLICFIEKIDINSSTSFPIVKLILKSLKNGIFSRNYLLINNLD